MSNQVILEQGETVNVHTRIKDLCKQARNRLGMSNQDIADAISERFQIDEFSVNTVNNFFSERSKACTVYTTGYICAVLNISIDTVFGIENNFSSEEQAEFVNQLSQLKVDLRMKDQEIEHLHHEIDEEEKRLHQAHVALDFYRHIAEKNNGKIHGWILNAVFVLFGLSLAIIGLLVFLYH